MQEHGLIGLLSKMDSDDLIHISDELRRIIQQKKEKLDAKTGTEQKKKKNYHIPNLKQLDSMIDRQMELLNTMTCGGEWGPDEIGMCNTSPTGRQTCNSGKCIICKKDTCLCNFCDPVDRICVSCEIEQIKEGKRNKLLYRW